MATAQPLLPTDLEVAIAKLAKGEPLSRAEGLRVLERVDELVGEPVLPEDAPLDDEPETPEEAAAVAEARAQIARGELLTSEEVKRNLGLL